MIYTVVNSDVDGITETSFQNLKQFNNKILERVVIEPGFPMLTTFIFKDHTAYEATGFAVGYSGEGPHGLHKAIRMFSDKIAENFEDTVISTLPDTEVWIWTPEKGFFLQ